MNANTASPWPISFTSAIDHKRDRSQTCEGGGLLYRAVVPVPSEPARGIRRASPDDAAGIVAVLGAVAGERVHSAIDRAWTTEQERRYLETLSPREIVHVAVDERSEIVGVQILDRWSTLESMAHVGQLGTFVLAAERRRGVGHQLWNATLPFARQAGYRKVVIQVRSGNAPAQAFYQGIGFRECGRLGRQVVIDGQEDDELLMELFL